MTEETKQPTEETKSKVVEGMLEVTDKGHGYLRTVKHSISNRMNDPFVHRDIIQREHLREGLYIEAGHGKKRAHGGKGGPQVTEVLKVNGHTLDEYLDATSFENFTVIDPNEMIHLETGAQPLGTRVIDLLTPIGMGQRGLIVAPPRTGKTILLRQIADGIAANHPEIHVMVLLIDERPEEVTEMRRNIKGEVIASSNDKSIDNHVRTAKLAIEKVKRLAEFGKNVVVLLDSITRLGRAFNAWVSSSGRTMSGGVDVRALQLPKQIFGSARNNENGGSLTILATALVDTGSRMDEVIFQEFKGTGNMELVLDRDLANKRIWPAINISQSGTRKEELLLDRKTLDKIYRLRRHLDSLSVGQDVTTLIRALEKYPSNKKFLASLP